MAIHVTVIERILDTAAHFCSTTRTRILDPFLRGFLYHTISLSVLEFSNFGSCRGVDFPIDFLPFLLLGSRIAFFFCPNHLYDV